MATKPATAALPDAVLSDADFARFREYFYRKTGIFFPESKRYFVDKRLIQRMQETGHSTFREYYMFMRFQASQAEFQQVVNAMTVNETYFFREEYQLKCMVGPVLDEIVRLRRGRSPIRIWSIPCSTGEEPYSIALYLLEYWPLIQEVDVEVMASDIDTAVLEKCRAGVFGTRSVHNLPRDILLRHFKRLNGDRYQISDDLRSAVDFSRVNVSEATDTTKMRGLDIIYCRNLLIYFDDASRWRAIEAFYDALNPGGFVFLGHAESISRTSSLFRVRKFDDAIAYQKPLT